LYGTVNLTAPFTRPRHSFQITPGHTAQTSKDIVVLHVAY
jgi:hypothetical protein